MRVVPAAIAAPPEDSKLKAALQSRTSPGSSRSILALRDCSSAGYYVLAARVKLLESHFKRGEGTLPDASTDGYVPTVTSFCSHW